MSVISIARGTKTPAGYTFSSPLPSPTVSSEVENIFVQNSLDEVKKVEEKLRFDIERKKDHLRSIVGERYRDLIDSADLISKLSQTSKQILTEVSSLKTHLGDVSRSLNTDGINQLDLEHSVSNDTYTRLLLTIPEEIYNSIDANQPVDAVLQYLLAGDICAHLQLTDLNSLVTLTQVQSRLARCRNSLVTCFRKHLGCLVTPIKGNTGDVTLVNSKAIGWLAASVAIDYLSPLKSYEEFLNCRAMALRDILQKNDSNTVSHAIHLYLSTALLSTALFVDNRSALSAEIEERVSKICPPAMSVEKEFIRFTLPQNIHGQLNKIVRHLTDACQLNTVDSLDPAMVYGRLTEWLKSSGELLAVEVPKILTNVENLQALQNLCDDISCVLSACCCQNHVPSVGEVWNSFLAHAIVRRFESLINEHFTGVKQELVKMLNSESKEVPPVIWASSKNSVLNMISKQAKENSLLGRSSSDLFVVSHFAGQQNSMGLQAAIISMDSLLALCRDFIASGLPLDSREAALIKMRQEASAFGNGIIEFGKSLLEKEQASKSPPERFLVLSSFCFTMTFLFNYVEDWLSTPNLSISGKPILSAKSMMADPVFWTNCRNQMSVISVELFQCALKTLMETIIKNEFSDNLRSISNPGGMQQKICHEMAWLNVEIDEEGDAGEKLKSKILIPQQPSLRVYNFLCALSRFTAQSPTFLLKQNNLNTVIFNSLVNVYRDFLTSIKVTDEGSDSESSLSMSQDLAIQNLFDFLLLTALLIGDHRRNQQFASACIDIIHDLESFVDPFDLNTFQPHLGESVRKCTKSVQSMFGLILSLDSASYRGGKSAPPHAGQTDDHNVLRLIQHQGRITALSVPYSQAQLYPV